MANYDIDTLHKHILGILLAVDKVCREHDIRYYCWAGTMLGAIRHKGFIPWDDDVDIIMPRPDYERFIASFKSPGLGIISEKDPDCYLNYCRVFDTVKTGSTTILPIGKTSR